MWFNCFEVSGDQKNQLPPELGVGPGLNFTPILDYSGGSSSGTGAVFANTVGVMERKSKINTEELRKNLNILVKKQ